MDSVTSFRCDAVELIALLPQRVGVARDFCPRELDVPDHFVVVVLSRDGNAVVVRPNIRVCREDGVRQVWRRLRTFTMGDKVFAVLDSFRFNTIALDAPRS